MWGGVADWGGGIKVPVRQIMRTSHVYNVIWGTSKSLTDNLHHHTTAARRVFQCAVLGRLDSNCSIFSRGKADANTQRQE